MIKQLIFFFANYPPISIKLLHASFVLYGQLLTCPCFIYLLQTMFHLCCTYVRSPLSSWFRGKTRKCYWRPNRWNPLQHYTSFLNNGARPMGAMAAVEELQRRPFSVSVRAEWLGWGNNTPFIGRARWRWWAFAVWGWCWIGCVHPTGCIIELRVGRTVLRDDLPRKHFLVVLFQ